MKVWNTTRKIKEQLTLAQIANEELNKKLEKFEELQTKISYKVFKELQDELDKKDLKISELTKQLSVLQRKQMEIDFVESRMNQLEEENENLKKELKRNQNKDES